jgi:hypothetical protein
LATYIFEPAQKYDEAYPETITPESDAFGTYQSQINKVIKKEFSQRYQNRKVPSIFRSEKNVGTRSLSELEIIYLSKRV